METHDGEADETQQHVDQDRYAPDLVLVTQPAGRDHDDPGKGVRRRHQTLGRADGEAQALVQDDGEEVGERVRDGGGVEKNQGITPDLPVRPGAQERAQGEGGHRGVATVGIDPADDPGPLAGGEEPPRLALGGVGEIDNEPVARGGDEAREDALDDENPTPSGNVGESIHLHQAVGENPCES